VVLLASCGTTEEESVEEPADALSAGELVRLVLDAERAIESIQFEMDRVAEEDGERSKTHSLYIRVGEDGYERWGDEDVPWDEVLTYEGVKYHRGEDGTWKTMEELFSFAMGAVDLVAVEGSDPLGMEPGAWDEALFSQTYALDFNQFLDAEVLDERSMNGRQMVGLSVSLTMPVPPSFDDIESQMFRPGMDVPDDVLEEFRKMGAKMPDTLRQTQVLWIGADDHLIYRVDVEGSAYRQDKVVESFTETRTYSRFNEVELPGPLPH
jgi:hypothetical protein